MKNGLSLQVGKVLLNNFLILIASSAALSQTPVQQQTNRQGLQTGVIPFDLKSSSLDRDATFSTSKTSPTTKSTSSPLLADAILACEAQSWNQQDKIQASDGQEDDLFGSSIAMSGNVAVIGAFLSDGNNINEGAAYIMRFNGTNWIEEAILRSPDSAGGAFFGSQVAIDNDVIVIGAPGRNEGFIKSGAIYVYRNQGGSWVLEAKITPPNATPFERFGRTLDLDGESIIVGVSNDDDRGKDAGAVYIYEFDQVSGTWNQSAKLYALDGRAGNKFGASVDITGDLIIVGAPRAWNAASDEHTGAAYIFRRVPELGFWISEGRLSEISTNPSSNFIGNSVAIEGDVAAIAMTESEVFVYRHQIEGWILEQLLPIQIPTILNEITLDGTRLLIGSRTNGRNLSSFKNSPRGSLYEHDGLTWSLTSTLFVLDSKAKTLGPSVAINGEQIMFGVSSGFGTDIPGAVYTFTLKPYSDCNGNGIADYCDTSNGFPDCNFNGLPDVCDIASGIMLDCDNNGIGDDCEINNPNIGDCNGNLIPDSCDLANGTSQDTNGNGIPDECDADCNNNGIGDANELIAGSSPDCNNNGIPDECDFDCNSNGIPDDCEIMNDPTLDENSNGILDTCDCPVQQKLLPDSANNFMRFSDSIDIDGDVAIVGAPREDTILGTNTGAVYIYRRKGLNWILEDKITASDGGINTSFGAHVAISGDIAVIGNPHWSSPSSSQRGAVYVFRYQPLSGQWLEEAIIEPDGVSAGSFGFGVDVQDGEIAFLAAYYDEQITEAFSAFLPLYKHDPVNGWVEQQRLSISELSDTTRFVWNPTNWLHFRGDQLIVGVPGGGGFLTDVVPGRVFLFRNDGDAWQLEHTFQNDTGDDGDLYGISVSLDGDRAIVGGIWNDEMGEKAGAAWIYRFDGAHWNLEQKFFSPAGSESHQFGIGVAIRGETAVISGKGRKTTSGRILSTYVYRLNSGLQKWELARTIQAFDGAAYIGFDHNLTVNENNIIISSRFDNQVAQSAGAVYIISGLFDPDCNGNLLPDQCDIFFERSNDINANAIPDECENPGDTDGNGFVNVLDLLGLLSSWGPCPVITCPTDLNADGKVNVSDLLILLSNWG